MKKIIYLTFYFEPDLCAGSFRNTSLAKVLAKRSNSHDIEIDVYTTFPNRYKSFLTQTKSFEKLFNLKIHRIQIPSHKNGIIDQILAFIKFHKEVLYRTKKTNADLVFASSSRLFTAYLGYQIAKKKGAILYLDIRDIFVDTISDLYQNSIIRRPLLFILKRIERQVFKYATHINLISPGFKNYFESFSSCNYTYYTNGVDDEFLQKTNTSKGLEKLNNRNKKTIVYAGNIGEGQGLHYIISKSAKILGENYEFHIYGDGGAKAKLIENLKHHSDITNVKIFNPVDRQNLIEIYQKSDYLFIHLNSIPAFKKVLPSKIFELATFPKIIVAGVAGYAKEFIQKEISDSIVFRPCDVDDFIDKIQTYKPKDSINRIEFTRKFKRSNINLELSNSILSYL